MKSRAWLALALTLVMASAAAAQFRGGFGFFRSPPRFPTAESFGHGCNFCRGVYTSGRREAGGQGWSTDYPDAERNFSIRLGELTTTRVSRIAQAWNSAAGLWSTERIPLRVTNYGCILVARVHRDRAVALRRAAMAAAVVP